MLWVLIAFLTGCSCQIHILKGTLMGPHHLAHQIAKPVIGDVPTVNIDLPFDESNERPPRDLRQYEYDPEHDVNNRAAEDTPNLSSNVGEKFKGVLNNRTNLQGKVTDLIKKLPQLQFGWVPPKDTAKTDSQIKENVTHISIGAADLDDVTAPSKKSVADDESKIGLKKLQKKIKKKIVKNALKNKPKYVLFYDKKYVTPDGRVIQIASNIPGRARNAEKPRRSNGPPIKRPLLMIDTDNESIIEDEPKVGIQGLTGYKLNKKIKKGAKKLLKNTFKKVPVYTNVITLRDSASNRGMWRIANPEKPQRRYVAVPQDPIIEYLNNSTGNLKQPSDKALERAETDTNTPEQSETGNNTDDETNINNLNYMRSQLLQYLMRYIRTTFTGEASERNNSVTLLDPRLTNYYDNSQGNDNDGDDDNTSVSDDENDDDNNRNDDDEHDENENDENEHGADEYDDHANDANEDNENEQQTQPNRQVSPHNDNEKSSCASDSSNMGNNVVIVDLKKKSNLNAGEYLTSTGSCGGTKTKKYVNAHREVNSTVISVDNVNAKPNHSPGCSHEAKHKTDKESESLHDNHSPRKVSLHLNLDLSSK